MLALQVIRMYWKKPDRSPGGAVIRKGYYHPERVQPEIINKYISADNINDCFLQRSYYRQEGEVITEHQWNRAMAEKALTYERPVTPLKQREEKYRRDMLSIGSREKEYTGVFLPCEDIDIPGIELEKHDDHYSVIWYSLDSGYKPVRTGKNINFRKKGAHTRGKQIKCEKAFDLYAGEAGRLMYNYRWSGSNGQRYELYCIYAVNADSLTPDIFIREYDKVYEDMAHLF